MMQTNSVKTIISCLWMISCVLASGINLRGAHGKTSRFLHHEKSVLCRITVLEISTTDAAGHGRIAQDDIRCIPIESGKETDDNFHIDLPDDMVEAHKAKIYRGQLIVSISHAAYINHELFLGNDSRYTVVEENHRFRHLLERHLQVTGEVTVAVVRVSTPAESPVPSTTQLSSVYFGNHGFQKQYGDCSGGKLNIKSNGVYDVKISQTKADLSDDYMKIVSAAQEQLRKDLGIAQVSDLANKVVMCLPGGTYAGSWSASAGVNSYFMQVRSEYCLSLSVTMHEIGHLFGLLHAGEAGQSYGDATGYMGASNADEDKPLKCFNGQNNDQLGWFSDKQYKFNPLTDGDALVKLSSFVDYSKASATEPVNVAIANKYFLQFNVAEGFNIGTQEMQNQVTVVETYSNGSNLLAGLSSGNEWKISNFMGSTSTLIIQACQTDTGAMGSKIMVLSVALDKSICSAYNGKSLLPTPKVDGNSGGSSGGTTTTPKNSGDSAAPYSGSSGSCFSSKNTVEVLGRGIISMDTLRIGDFVRTGSGDFSQVYSFGHLDRDMETNFLQVFSKSRDFPLEVSPDHMVFVYGKAVRASEVKVGNMLGDHAVVEIRSVQRQGVYAPVTFAGDIVVSGVVASSYVALLDGVPAHIQNTASHATTAMHRLVCKFDFDLCENETYTNGINDWIATAVQWVLRVNHHNLFIQVGAWLLAIPLVAFVFTIEQVMISPTPIFALLLGLYPICHAFKRKLAV